MMKITPLPMQMTSLLSIPAPLLAQYLERVLQL
nr:MAG TPA: hypothetical protein [Bacteriophage sp.]